jgi:exonuclease-1
MGITGLLPALKHKIIPAHIREFKGRKVAVDTYAWLHKSTYGCCIELCTGKKTTKWIEYCMSMLEMLLKHDIQVVLVFDGAELPVKKVTESSRSSSRQENMEKGLKFLSQKDYEQARRHLSGAVNVTPEMAAELISVVRANRPQVACYVAPYEADAMYSTVVQMKTTIQYLSKHTLLMLTIIGWRIWCGQVTWMQ